MLLKILDIKSLIPYAAHFQLQLIVKTACNLGGRLPYPVEGLMGGRGILASSLLLPSLCNHDPLETHREGHHRPLHFQPGACHDHYQLTLIITNETMA